MHSQSAKIRADRLCAVAGELQEDTSRILRITFLKSGYFKGQNNLENVLFMSSSTYHYFSDLGCIAIFDCKQCSHSPRNYFDDEAG